MRRIAIATTSAAAALALTASTAWALITPVKVLSLPAVQILPFSNDAYLAYASNSTGHPNHYNADAYRYSDHKIRRLNAAHTQGYDGGFDPGTNTVIYQQITNNSSDLYTYNLDTLTRHKLGAIDNTSWEWQPRISTSFISFFRDFKVSGTWYVGVFLFDRDTGRLRRLAAYRWVNHPRENGSLGDLYASWTVCWKKTCAAYVYDVQAGVVRKIPTNNGRPQYGPAVDETNGLVFFVRSGFGCGHGVTIFKASIGNLSGAPTKVGTLPAGVDLAGVSASLALNPGTNEYGYFFSRENCRSGASDIYALRGVSPGPV